MLLTIVYFVFVYLFGESDFKKKTQIPRAYLTSLYMKDVQRVTGEEAKDCEIWRK